MAAQLSDCTIVEQRAVIRLLWSEGGKTVRDLQKNVRAVLRKLYSGKEGVPLGWKGSAQTEHVPTCGNHSNLTLYNLT